MLAALVTHLQKPYNIVNHYIEKLNCPTEQKIELLDAIIKTASGEK